MKLFVSAALALLTTMTVSASVVHDELFVVGYDPVLVKELSQQADLTIDHIHVNEGFEVYGPKGLSRYLDERGVLYYDLKDAKKSIDWTSYPSFEQIQARLKELAAKFPNIARLESIGKSVKGRDLWVMKISDNPASDEVEPEFKYISSMHGDEITGRELTIRLIDDLLENYGKDPRITALIDSTEIYIMPSMNPDGSELRQRANANYIDLNRNFPEAVRNDPNNQDGRQPETKAVMSFQARRNFSLSANFHGGAVVANYPWDARYDRHPLDGLVHELSLEYSKLNPEMYSSRQFENGVTNGAEWYVLYGGMQDWSYVWHNDLQITVELSDSKWPNYKDIPRFYTDNRESMLRYIELVHRGAGVRFADAKAEGTVNVITEQGKNMGTYGFQRGEFYKILNPGRYKFLVNTKGAGEISKKTVDVEIGEDVSIGDRFISL